MLSHSFDRFFVVTKFELPKLKDLKLTMLSYDSTCQYLEKAKSIQSYPPSIIGICKISTLRYLLIWTITRNK